MLQKASELWNIALGDFFVFQGIVIFSAEWAGGTPT
jgi:hypothetical protein